MSITLAEAAKDHPNLATAASGGILSGIIAGGAKGASWLLPALFGNLPEGGVAKALGSTVGTAAKWGARGSGWTTAAMIAYEAYQNRDEIGRDIVGKGEHATTGDPWRTGYDRDHPAGTLDQLRRERDERDAQRAAIHGGLPTGGGTPVTATLTGSAEVHGEMTGKFEVTASSTLISIVQTMQTLSAKLTGLVSTNGPGSTGKSSPDAAAPPPRGRGPTEDAAGGIIY